MTKKLIEVSIPLEAINAASSREKSMRHGHPSSLHLWWARRPLAACRAVLFAQLVDDPSEYVDILLNDPKIRAAAEMELAKRILGWGERQGDRPEDAVAIPKPSLEEVIADLERQRLFRIIEELVKWENSTNEKVLDEARAEIVRSCNGVLPPVYDPFSGGGSIPLEAQRLGLPAYGSDLNPVAVMIGKAMIEIPPKFCGIDPIHPGIHQRNHYRNVEGLAEDVKFYGEWIRERAYKQIGHLYPDVDLPNEFGGGKATVIAWIWARTVPSPDPAFSDVDVPIASSFLLSSKPGKEAWIKPIIDRTAKTISYQIRHGGTKAEIAAAKEGTKSSRANFTCLMSGAAITGNYVKQAGKIGRMGETLIAIVAEGKNGRQYVPPKDSDVLIALSNEASVIAKECRETFLSGEVPPKLTGGTCHGYGLDQWGKLFTDRQLVALNTFSELVHEARAQIEQDAQAAGMELDQIALKDDGCGAKAYAEAVSIYLSFLIGQMANHTSTICGWNSPNQQMRSTFSRQAIPMTWDFAEVNVFNSSSGGFNSLFLRMIKGFEGLGSTSVTSGIYQRDAQSVDYDKDVVVSTDPPYYDNIAYADLSDFFFLWMKRINQNLFPEIFGVLATPKAEELVATSYRHGGNESAELFFLEGMRKVIFNMSKGSSSEFPTTIYYAFKQSEIEREGISSTGWATFVQAILDAGYSVVGTWPLRTEKPGRMVAVGTNALANSVVLVCRKKEATAAEITRAEFLRALKRELPPAIAKLQAANIAPADMPQSAIGPGMGVFSRYAAVLESDDRPMSVKTALQLINAELDTFLNSLTGDFDAETRFAVTWFEQFGYDKGEFGTAQSLCQARGLAVDAVKHAGIIESAAGKVRLLTRSELSEKWDPNRDLDLTIWECLQYLVRALDGGEESAARVLNQIRPERAGAVKDLAYYLYDLAGNKRRDASEATAYNSLIALWSDLTGLASTVRDDVDRQASLF